jgi:16S rRNA (uracil1498-N3)-methyltransferase
VAAEPRAPDSSFWVEPEGLDGDTLRLTDEESHHLLRVFRAAPGALFQATDGRGMTFDCLLVSGARGRAVGRVTARRPGAGELPVPLCIMAGLPEPAAAEELVIRAVPLGATHILFFRAERSERWRPIPARLARLERLARAALKQSRRSRLPCIQFAAGPEEAIEAAPEGSRHVADPDGGSWSEVEVSGASGGAVLGVGPPGGLAEREKALFVRGGFSGICLGPSRLTTQDAASAMLALARERILWGWRGRD